MFSRTHTSFSPWIIVKANNKKKARLESIRYLLSNLDYRGKDDARTSLAHLRLGQLLLDLKRYQEAETELLQAERTLVNLQGLAPARHAKCMQTLAEFYEAWQSAEPGQDHDREAAKWRVMLHTTDAAPSKDLLPDKK